MKITYWILEWWHERKLKEQQSSPLLNPLLRIFYFALISCVLISCSKKHMPPPLHATQISMVYNITEVLTSPPLPEPILSLFDIQNDKDQQMDFKITLLQGTLLNPTQAVHTDGLLNGKRVTHEEIEQHAQLAFSFRRAVRNAIIDFPKEYGAGKSPARFECFATIAQELEMLAGNTASQRILIVFGSLNENNPKFSSRSPNGKQLLKTNPAKVIQLLQKRRRLPDNLVGISVFFVFQPGNKEDAELYANIVGIYRQLLRERGARVIIQLDNKNFQP